MIELTLWVLFGSLCGWIGYLSSRTGRNHAKPYVIIGILAAVAGGSLARITDHSAGIYSISMNGLMFALMTSAVCMIALGFFGKTTSHHR